MVRIVAPANRDTRKRAIDLILNDLGEEDQNLNDCVEQTVKEVISNVIQHGEDREIEIVCTRDSEEVVVTVRSESIEQHAVELAEKLAEARRKYKDHENCGFRINEGHGLGHVLVAALTTYASYDRGSLEIRFDLNNLPNSRDLRIVY